MENKVNVKNIHEIFRIQVPYHRHKNLINKNLVLFPRTCRIGLTKSLRNFLETHC